MGGFYSDAQYGYRVRKWFGLGPKWGGDGSAYRSATDPDTALTVAKGMCGGFGLGTHDPGTITHVEKWYPPGPISIKKIGVFVCSTYVGGSEGRMSFQFLTRGASASVIGYVQFSSATMSECDKTASLSGSSLTVRQCKAGEYIAIKSIEGVRGDRTSATATEVKATSSGRVAFFIDYVPKYDPDRWGDDDLL